MKPIVQSVTDEEFAILAQFIATELGQGKAIGSGNPDPASPGGKLFKSKTCVACHGKDGKTPVLKAYPKIAGLSAEYAKMQMLDIKNGARANSQAVLGMKGIMHLVSEEEINHLADYIATLPR
ncbi:MAG: c-type cytochrome [bacterium]|nr:c-type cytochrome [bacterium]